MKITKLGHCCLVIEEQGKKILTDPGAWSTSQNEITGLDLILITHEHQDHFHLDSLKIVLQNNPQAKIITNSAVGKLLDKENIPYEILEDGATTTWEGIDLAAFGQKHAEIYKAIPPVMNTGYLIANRFFYPGDAFTNPGQPVEILAVPMAGPWMKLAEAIDWAREIKPKACIPVHDGMLEPRQWIYGLPQKFLSEDGIAFAAIEPSESKEF